MLGCHSDLVLDCQPDVPRSKSHCDTGPNFLTVGKLSLSLEKAFQPIWPTDMFEFFTIHNIDNNANIGIRGFTM